MSTYSDEISSEAQETFFNTMNKFPFPNLENGQIDTYKFLEASHSVVELIDQLGKIFAPVKYDMTGNIQKLTRKYEEDPSGRKYLQSMVLSDYLEGDGIGTDALKWLRRGLEFLYAFLQRLIDDPHKNDNISQHLRDSYASTLQQYHGWMARRLFRFLCGMCPTRKQMFLVMALNRDYEDEIVVRDMSFFNAKLYNCIDELKKFYYTFDLETANEIV